MEEVQTMAWIYPGAPCNAQTEYADGRHINVLKPQYYTLQDDGTLVQDTSEKAGCNGYSPTDVASVKQHSDQQFVTISGPTSGEITGIFSLATNPALTNAFTNTLLSFLNESGFTGVELDFEQFAKWSPQQYIQYKAFIATLGSTLHTHGYQLMLDTPAISNTTEQGYYPFKYEDFNQPPLSQVVTAMNVMAYDQQDDNGAGTAVQPLAWLKNICVWMKTRITDTNRVVIGIPSYGYHGKTATYGHMTIDTYSQSKMYPGFSTAQRDPLSGEMIWSTGGTSYVYSDSATLDGKLKVVQDAGLSRISVWHLGGNLWFGSQSAAASPSPVPQPVTIQPQPAASTPQTAARPLSSILGDLSTVLTEWAQQLKANGQ